MTKLTDIQILIDTCMQLQIQLHEQLFDDEDAYKYFTFKETQDILESAGLLIDAYINDNIMTFSDPDFHEKVFENVELLLIQQETL